MSSGKMLRLTLLGIVFIFLAVGVLFAMRLTRGSSSEIALPTPIGSGTSETEDLPVNIDILYVSEDNVQAIIGETLVRPAEYSRGIMVESFWDGGSDVDNFNVSVRDGVTAIRTSFGGTTKNIVVTDEYRYIWYTGDSVPFRQKNFNGSHDDEHQKILTYENILKLDKSQIISAGFLSDANGPGIFVKYISGPFDYVTEVYVSIELGLITGAEQYDG
ncbi:MAG: hypothetical protein GX823_06915, partial [Clostridiales bacterium]|nr:hypothetical protein [Clostridiales bacterium]